MTRIVLPYIPPAIGWGVLLYKSPGFVRRRGDPANRAYWIGLLSFSLAMTVLLPPVYRWFDHTTGFANLARLAGNSFGLVAAWMALTFLAYLNYPPDQARVQARRTGWLLVVVVLVMTCLFVLAPVKTEAIDFWGRYRDAPYIPEYRFAFLAYLGVTLANAAFLAWRNSGITDRPALILGLRLVAIGCLLGLAYVVQEALFVVTTHLGYSVLPLMDTVAQILIAASAALILLGSTLPAWGSRAGIPVLYRWACRYRSYRRLYHLWRVLYGVFPDIALLPARPALADAFTVRDLEFRLYRRVVEIRDGLLALRPYVDPDVTSRAAELCRTSGLSTEQTQVVMEAASLAGALKARRRGEAVNRDCLSFGSGGGADVGSEVAALEGIAYCYAHSSIVRAAVASNGRRHVA